MDDWRRKLGSGLAQWFLMNKYPLEKQSRVLQILMKFWFLHCYIAIPTWKSLDTLSREIWNQSMAKQIDYKQDNCSWTRSSLKEGQKMEILRSIRPSLNWFWQEGGESIPFSSQSVFQWTHHGKARQGPYIKDAQKIWDFNPFPPLVQARWLALSLRILPYYVCFLANPLLGMYFMDGSQGEKRARSGASRLLVGCPLMNSFMPAYLKRKRGRYLSPRERSDSHRW